MKSILRKVDKTRAEWTIKMTLNYLSGRKINLDCAVQRGFEWSKDPERMSQLILSLIYERPIPPLYMAKRDNIYFAIDGKQRISTARAFVNDEFALTGLDPVEIYDEETDDVEEVDVNGFRFSELPEIFKDAIESAVLTIVIINDATDDEICEYFYYLNNGVPLNAITMTRAKAKSRNSIVEIGSHELFKNALTAKALAKHTNEDIVIKTYMMLNEENPALDTASVRKKMADIEITDIQKKQVMDVFDRILELYRTIDDKKIAKRILTRTHMISIVPFVWQSISEGLSVDIMAKWISQFYCGKVSATNNYRYNAACRAGSAKKESVKARNEELAANFNKFFGKTQNKSSNEANESEASEGNREVATIDDESGNDDDFELAS